MEFYMRENKGIFKSEDEEIYIEDLSTIQLTKLRDSIDNEITIRNHKLEHHGDIKQPKLDKSIRVLRDYGLSLQGYIAITEHLSDRYPYSKWITIYGVLLIPKEKLNEIDKLGENSQKILFKTIEKYCEEHNIDVKSYPIFS